MHYTEAPMDWYPVLGSPPGVFLAGGITGCPDWQQQMVAALHDAPVALLNPRRAAFPMDNPAMASTQILWEYHHLRRAAAILFWFPVESLCPITLYELGAWSMTDKPIFVGCAPGYQRAQDVQIQTGLARPAVTVVSSLAALAGQVRHWLTRAASP